MKTDFKVENPDGIKMTLTITMILAEWKKLKKDLDDVEHVWSYHPTGALRKCIREAVYHAETHFKIGDEDE